MVRFKLDKETWLLYPLFALGTSTSLGIIEPTLIPFINLSSTVTEAAGIALDWARLLSIVALLAVTINRDAALSTDDWSVFEVWAVYVTVGSVVAPPFFPALQETLVEPLIAFVTLMVQSIGFVIITYLN